MFKYTKRALRRNLHMLKSDANTFFYAYEGLLLAIVIYLISNNNNLFATRLGGRDYTLGLVQGLPQVAAMLVLIPGAIFADSLKDKKKMVIASIFSVSILYLLIALVPFLPSYQLEAFIFLLSLSAGAMTLYNLSWQAYFADVTHINLRNKVLTRRTHFTLLAGFLVPLVTGLLLTSTSDVSLKIMFHQLFFAMAGLLIFVQIFLFSKVKPENPIINDKPPINFGVVLQTLKILSRNKKFLGFVSVAFVFYMAWQLDWTIFYIMQVEYLHLNEWYLSLTTIFSMGMQFISLRFWSKVNERFSVNFSMIFTPLFHALIAGGVIFSLCLSPTYNKFVFLFIVAIGNLATAQIVLNPLQMLLKVIPEENKTLSISIYTMFIAFSNAAMPIVGVAIYRGFGGDLLAMKLAFALILVVRLISCFLFILWDRYSKKLNTNGS